MNCGLVQMLAELESHQLQVCLVPLSPSRRGYNEGGMKRALMDRNPKWYRDLCLRFPSSRVRRHRKPDTRIRRRDILRILTRLAMGLRSRSKYADELRAIAGRVKP
jgi:hypothetical protein